MTFVVCWLSAAKLKRNDKKTRITIISISTPPYFIDAPPNFNI